MRRKIHGLSDELKWCIDSQEREQQNLHFDSKCFGQDMVVATETNKGGVATAVGGNCTFWTGTGVHKAFDKVGSAAVLVKAGYGPEAEFLAKLVALHISAHPAGVTKGCLAFQEKLNGAMAQGPVSGVETDA
jgi:hypothetical protein